MTNRKMNLDRPNLNSEQIRQRQDFDKVLSKHYLLKPPMWKNPWFWGPTGLASIGIALFFSVSNINSQNNSNEKTNTLALKELPEDTECIHPPLKEEDVPFQHFEVDARKAETIVLPDGTSIEIPKGSLLPENSNKKVEIEVREFPDKVSAFVAGIPMDYQTESAFESAGMIEIRGKQDGEIVAINPEKPIEVKLALTKDPKGFDFWYLNETSKAWEKYPASIVEKPAATVKPFSPVADLKQKIEKIDQQLVVCEQKKEELKKPIKADYKIPEENHQKFDLDFNKKTYPELAKFENLVFEIIPTSGYDKTFTKKTWSEVKLEKAKENYEMIFIAASEKMKVAVRPVLQGKELKSAEKEFDVAMEDFATALDKIEAEKKTLQDQKAKTRTALEAELERISETPASTTSSSSNNQMANFEVLSWGVYNSDKPNPYPAALKQEAAFVWEGHTSPAEFKALYVFNLKKDMRYTYGSGAMHSIQQFGMDKKDDLVILGIDRGGELGFCEFKNRKDKSEPQRIVFSKREEGSAKDLLNKLINETVPV